MTIVVLLFFFTENLSHIGYLLFIACRTAHIHHEKYAFGGTVFFFAANQGNYYVKCARMLFLLYALRKINIVSNIAAVYEEKMKPEMGRPDMSDSAVRNACSGL